MSRLMTVGDEDVAVGRHQHRIGFMKGIRAVARNPGLAERTQQFAAAVEFEHIIALAVADMAVGDPE